MPENQRFMNRIKPSCMLKSSQVKEMFEKLVDNCDKPLSSEKETTILYNCREIEIHECGIE